MFFPVSALGPCDFLWAPQVLLSPRASSPVLETHSCRTWVPSSRTQQGHLFKTTASQRDAPWRSSSTSPLVWLQETHWPYHHNTWPHHNRHTQKTLCEYNFFFFWSALELAGDKQIWNKKRWPEACSLETISQEGTEVHSWSGVVGKKKAKNYIISPQRRWVHILPQGRRKSTLTGNTKITQSFLSFQQVLGFISLWCGRSLWKNHEGWGSVPRVSGLLSLLLRVFVQMVLQRELFCYLISPTK